MSNFKLTQSEDEFANNEIKKHYQSQYSKYSNCIDQTMSKISDGISDFDKLCSNDKYENIIIKKLLIVFLNHLNREKNNDSGIFGVGRSYFSDDINLYYKNLVKKEFTNSNLIYARTLVDLKNKVTENKGIWYVYDEQKKNKFIKKYKYKPKKKTKKRNIKVKREKTINQIIRKNRKNKYLTEIKNDEKNNREKMEQIKYIGVIHNKDYKDDRYKFYR